MRQPLLSVAYLLRCALRRAAGGQLGYGTVRQTIDQSLGDDGVPVTGRMVVDRVEELLAMREIGELRRNIQCECAMLDCDFANVASKPEGIRTLQV